MDGGWETPASAPRRPRRWKPWVLGGLALLGAGLAVTLGIMGAVRSNSLDLPLPNNVRFGFFQNRGPVRWTCSDGHDHWSMPFWLGSVGAGALALLLVRLTTRAARDKP